MIVDTANVFLVSSRRDPPMAMKLTSLLLIVLVTSVSFGASTEGEAVAGITGNAGFEPAEGLRPSAEIATFPGWKSSTRGIGVITDATAHAGTQSLGIKASSAAEALVMRKFAAPKDGIVFLDFFLLPPADPAAEPSYTVDAAGARLAFVRTDAGKGAVLAVPAGRTQAVETGFEFAIDEDGSHASDWIRVTLREDLEAGTWDLFLDGRLVLVDQPLAKAGAPAALSFYPSETGSAWVDDLAIAHDNPLFADADKDSVPDAVESVQRSDPNFDDRETRNSDGMSNIEQFLALSKDDSSRIGSRRIIYVDNVSGSDAETGEFSYSFQGRGAKASLAAALAEREPDTLIVLIGSNKPYRIDARAQSETLPINIMPLTSATIEGDN
jgi:hypothetical protein